MYKIRSKHICLSSVWVFWNTSLWRQILFNKICFKNWFFDINIKFSGIRVTLDISKYGNILINIYQNNSRYDQKCFKKFSYFDSGWRISWMILYYFRLQVRAFWYSSLSWTILYHIDGSKINICLKIDIFIVIIKFVSPETSISNISNYRNIFEIITKNIHDCDQK